MQFSPELREGVTSGRITVSFRLWSRSKVKVGGRYAVGSARIEVDAIEVVPFSGVTRADVRRSGEKDREALRRRAAHAGPIDDDTLLHRVDFHVVPPEGG
ncbi:MAG TPA: ASCH domain-containing protein [Acidimicrobiia bacterium]